MGTSFDCAVTVSTKPETGQLVIGIGPLDMGNLAEMLDYLGSEECREGVIEAATKAFMAQQKTPAQQACDTADDIWRAIQAWQLHHQQVFTGTIGASLDDLRAIDEQQQQRQHGPFGGWCPTSSIKVGDRAQLWGKNVIAQDRPAGTWELLP